MSPVVGAPSALAVRWIVVIAAIAVFAGDQVRRLSARPVSDRRLDITQADGVHLALDLCDDVRRCQPAQEFRIYPIDADVAAQDLRDRGVDAARSLAAYLLRGENGQMRDARWKVALVRSPH